MSHVFSDHSWGSFNPPSSTQFSSIKLVKGILHVAPARKFRNPFATPVEGIGFDFDQIDKDAGGGQLKTFEKIDLDAACDRPVVVAVGVGHLSCLPHVVLQVLQIKIFGVVWVKVTAVNQNCKSKSLGLWVEIHNGPARKWRKKDSPQQACIQSLGQGAAKHRVTYLNSESAVWTGSAI